MASKYPTRVPLTIHLDWLVLVIFTKIAKVCNSPILSVRFTTKSCHKEQGKTNFQVLFVHIHKSCTNALQFMFAIRNSHLIKLCVIPRRDSSMSWFCVLGIHLQSVCSIWLILSVVAFQIVVCGILGSWPHVLRLIDEKFSCPFRACAPFVTSWFPKCLFFPRIYMICAKFRPLFL